ncbi:hemerythrin domain-containing protein [Kribbella sp. NPDC048915]|uniref:hemerythrin domain-containing protein n=1 Tax=Kribbella sp. NPDC048915 TaxID=3155148 RepID=UPI0033D6D351
MPSESTTAGSDRVAAAAAQLRAIHDGLREQLSATLAAVDAYLDGSGPAPERLTSLHEHCLSFCGALHAHHSREDSVFPRLAADFPELKPVLDRLSQEHTEVAALNEQISTTLDQLSAAPTRAETQRLRTDIDRLTATLESHYGYEEAHLAPALA